MSYRYPVLYPSPPLKIRPFYLFYIAKSGNVRILNPIVITDTLADPIQVHRYFRKAQRGKMAILFANHTRHGVPIGQQQKKCDL